MKTQEELIEIRGRLLDISIQLDDLAKKCEEQEESNRILAISEIIDNIRVIL